MNIVKVILRHISVPLRMKFRTAQTERTFSDNIVVEVVLENGVSGFGEGVPREYVTGESVSTCFEFLRPAALPLLNLTCASFAEAVELAAGLPFGDDPLHPNRAAHAALDLALLDAAGRHFDVPLYRTIEWLPEMAPIARTREFVRYGVVMSAGSGRLSAWMYRLYGFRDVKLKVGDSPEDDLALVEAMRRRLGDRIEVRVDVNGAWTPEQAIEILPRLHELNVTSVEQPVAVEQMSRLAATRPDNSPMVMLDESLVTEADAKRAVAEKLGDAFNIRISKNGGLIPSMRLAKLAADNGMVWQLGCHPGETGLLSAAGRAFACSVQDVRYLEGSYDRHLLARNIIKEDVTFGWGGRAKRLEGPGLGVTVDRKALEELTKEMVVLTDN